MTTICPQNRRVAWFGPINNNLGWLRDRIAELGYVEWIERSEITAESMAALLDQRIDRILIAVENRLDFPEKTLQKLDMLIPEIPVGIVTGNWWSGARRTGWLPRQHLIQPWHRWWDVWSDWVEGVQPKLFGPDIGPSNHLIHRSNDYSMLEKGQLAIVCDSRSNAMTWQQQWSCHVESTWLRPSEWKSVDSLQASCILYDLDDISNCDIISESHRSQPSGAYHLLVSSIPEAQWLTKWRQGSRGGHIDEIGDIVSLASKPLGPRGIVRILIHIQSTGTGG